MQQVTGKLHGDVARKFKKLFTIYEQNRDLINIGAYQPGSDLLLDEAVQKFGLLQTFIQQDTNEKCTVDQSITTLLDIFEE